jgi:hypothetical protein
MIQDCIALVFQHVSVALNSAFYFLISRCKKAKQFLLFT